MDNDDFDLKSFLHQIDGDFNVLDEEIDINTQKEFFEMSEKISPELLSLSLEDFLQHLKSHNEQTAQELKQNLYILSTFENVNAYRALEAFKEQCSQPLRPWCCLALQQSLMMLQHSLDNQQQVVISTGLGGKNGKLRYQLIFPFITDTNDIQDFQVKVLKDELRDQMSASESEVEDFEASQHFAIATVLMPLEVELKTIVIKILKECNQFGTYLSEGVVVTNVKRFSNDEIEKIISGELSNNDNVG